jgi:hypothetical protein
MGHELSDNPTVGRITGVLIELDGTVHRLIENRGEFQRIAAAENHSVPGTESIENR